MTETITKEVTKCKECPHYSVYKDMGSSTPTCNVFRSVTPTPNTGIPKWCPELIGIKDN